MRDLRIGIIGGGITGLCCAHYLAQRGYAPVVFESSRAIDHARGCALDPLPVGLSRSDTAACGLIADLGLTSRLRWHDTRCAVHVDGRQYALSGWSDLLRLGALRPAQRARAAAAAYACMRLRTSVRHLDAQGAQEWLTRSFGREVYEVLWRPALRARFGSPHADALPAYAALQFIREELLGATRTTGVLRGGTAELCAALSESVLRAGGEIQTDAAVRALSVDGRRVRVRTARGCTEELDAVIVALPLSGLPGVLKGDLAEPLLGAARRMRQQRAVSVRCWVRGRAPLGPYSRVVNLQPSAFPIAIDASAWLPGARRPEHRLLYLGRIEPENLGGSLGEDEAHKLALDGLQQLDPGLVPDQLEEVTAFEWAFPEPAWSVDTLQHPIPRRLGQSPLFVCTPAQAYPHAATQEASVMLARECVGQLVREVAPH